MLPSHPSRPVPSERGRVFWSAVARHWSCDKSFRATTQHDRSCLNDSRQGRALSQYAVALSPMCVLASSTIWCSKASALKAVALTTAGASAIARRPRISKQALAIERDPAHELARRTGFCLASSFEPRRLEARHRFTDAVVAASTHLRARAPSSECGPLPRLHADLDKVIGFLDLGIATIAVEPDHDILLRALYRSAGTRGERESEKRRPCAISR